MNVWSRIPILFAAAAVLSACGGGSGTSSLPSRASAAHPAPTAAGPSTLTFRFVRPARTSASVKRKKPLYLSPSTQSVAIYTVSADGTQFTTLTYVNFTCPAQPCTGSATATLAPGTYNLALFAMDQPITDPANQFSTANGPSALPGSQLSQNVVPNIVVQPGPNTIHVTLDGVVSYFGISPKVTTIPAAANATVPISLIPYDADGNLISGAYGPGGSGAAVSFQEVDNYGAFSLVPGSGSTAACQNQAGSGFCTINTGTDTIELQYNGSASGFPADPGYYPAEAILSNGTSFTGTVTASTSAAVATAPCSDPAPLCVYSRPAYPLFLSAGGPVPLAPHVDAASGTTIWTDEGNIAWGGGTPVYTLSAQAANALPIQSLTVAPGGASAWGTDNAASELYNFPASAGGDGLIDLSIVPYNPPPANTTQGGSQIVAAPDGNLWWIDQTYGTLLYASASSLSSGSPNVSVCVLNTLLQVSSIATNFASSPTPRLWFTATDNNSNNATFGQVVAGYINFSATGSHANTSCGKKLPVAALPTSVPGTYPYSSAVDGKGQFWATDPFAGNFLMSGTVNGGGQPILTSTAMPAVPSGDYTGDPVFAPAGGTAGYIYMVDVDYSTPFGAIVRIDPSIGASSSAAFVLPSVVTPGLSPFPGQGGMGSYGSLLAWVAGGTSGLGYLELVIPGLNFVDGSAVVGIDVGDSRVAFSSALRRRGHSASVKRRAPFHTWTAPRRAGAN